MLGLLLSAILVLGALFFVQTMLDRPGPASTETTILIPPGTSTRQIAAQLEEKGLVASRWLVLAAVAQDRLKGRRAVLKAGEYAIPAHASVREIVDLLEQGKAILYRITIPEGFSVVQVLKRLRANPYLSGEITQAPPEGSLLPDTYTFRRGESRQALIERMQKAQKRLIAELWPRRAPDLPFRTPYEAIILASIVEKETAIPAERPRIAAVFINRLKKGMRLQADPTIIYGITRGLPLGRPIRRSEIAAKTPWNTYQIDGLPPTPIANPGRDSIKAVLNPEKTDLLYFVADGKGGHVFAATLAEHRRNVRKWRAMRRRTIKDVHKAVTEGKAAACSGMLAAGDGRTGTEECSNASGASRKKAEAASQGNDNDKKSTDTHPIAVGSTMEERAKHVSSPSKVDSHSRAMALKSVSALEKTRETDEMSPASAPVARVSNERKWAAPVVPLPRPRPKRHARSR